VKPLFLVVLLTVLSHIGFVGTRMTVSLAALHEGASPLTVGVLMSLCALLPMLLSVQAGRLIDRAGAFRPVLWSSAALVAGILLPFASPSLPALFVTVVLIGTAFMIQHITLNHIVGTLGDPAERAVNFSWLALGYATSGFFGPLLAGYSIDLVGHRFAFLVLAVTPLAALVIFLRRTPPLPPPQPAKPGAAERRVTDLLSVPKLRAAFLFSGLLAAGWDMYTFVIPIYGSQIGLAASTIGVVMASFAAATFAVRLAMPVIARRANEWAVVCAALVISGSAYSLFALADRAPTLMALSFFLGLGLGCAQPMIMSVLYAASPPGRQGEAVGVRSTVLNASHTLLPLVFGAVGTALGVVPVFLAMAGLLLSGGWLADRQRRLPA
jgi:predicted MFS family arabinose efflux permease